ncbi:DUF3784 domain-containing protein [Haloarchaeobius amylolyticus]|uniref:DUF3784 domain-containing protein n=1 Tax=Haloarchaeobius amylolyticus TaxID=1198296 RepID=A0ABD6BFX7_9EURY
MVTASVVSLIVTAGFIGALGILIKHFGIVQLIAGYDPDRATDEAELADFVGTNVLYVAALVLLVAIVEATAPDRSDSVWIAFVAGVGLLTVRMIRGARRYESDE